SFLLLAALLVLLRLAIGWHFYIEGAKKVESRRAGESLINKPFSSAGYLRGSTGPFADTFRGLGDDPDREALARLDAAEPDADMEAGRKPWTPLLPPALKTHYDDYFERFVEHLDLGDERVTVEYRVDVPLAGEILMKDEAESSTGQLDLAKARLAQAKE